ncbi:MAG: flagellar hook-length control protein FliK, partial [Desulfonatronovibrio sp.]|nr:flagellar hook-length control protein FliK [Desulfovibrionales bacterium]
AKADEAIQGKTKEDPWEKFLSKIRNSDSADMKNATIADAKARAAADSATQKAAIQNKEFVSRQVLDQVQNGMFKRLSEGRTQITLQLDPPSLGKIGVILQMHDKEVRATIRPSSPEVAQIVSDNMAKLKASLEQQGLRVNKIEVQTQMQENHSQTWHGQEEHNKARDRMREAIRIAKLKGLDGPGDPGTGVDGAILMNSETRDGPGLDLFA